MSAQIEIVFTDEGSNVPALPETTDYTGTPGSSRPAVPMSAPSARGERVSGPPKRWKGEPAAADSPQADSGLDAGDLAKAAGMAAAAIGAGGLAKQALTLYDAFGKLYTAVTASGDRLKEAAPPLSIDEISPRGSVFDGPQEASDPLEPLPSVTDRLFGPGAGQSDAELNDAMRAALEGVLGPGRGGVIKGPSAAAKSAPIIAEAVGAEAGAGAGGAAGGMGALAAAAGPAAIAVAALTAAVAAGVVVVKKTWDALASEADRLSGLSGPLAAARAGSEVRAEMADLRRAQEIGPALARFEDTRGRVMEKLADLNTKILEVILRFTNRAEPIINALLPLIDVLGAALPVAADSIQSLVEAQNGNLAALKLNADELKNLKILSKELVNLTKDARDFDGREDPFMTLFLQQFADPAKARPGGAERAAAFRAARANIGQPFIPDAGGAN